MSGSDSDQEFESADEDTDYEPASKQMVNQLPKIEKSSNVIVKEDSIDYNVTDNHPTNKEKNDVLETLEPSQTDNSKNAVEDTAKNVSQCSKMFNESSSCENVTNIPEGIIKDKLHVEASRPKRVPLRRENMRQKVKPHHNVAQENEAVQKTEETTSSAKDTKQETQSTWGFGGWGSSFLSTAVSSVSTFSSHVSQGIGTVLETVENTIGAPPAEELARSLAEKKDSECTTSAHNAVEGDSISNLMPDVSAWTKVLEDTGSKVVYGGLSTLELIGKKTINILTENDPGLRKARSAFSDKVNLSEILREAKARAEEHASNEDSEESEAVHYSQVFDEHQGLSHLEALEMLSKQTESKVKRLLARHQSHTELRHNLEEIRVICENLPLLDDVSECDTFQDFDSVLKKHCLELSFRLNVDNVVNTKKTIEMSIKKFEEESSKNPDLKEIYNAAVCSLAEFTAKCIEIFHKAAELIMIQQNLDTEICATSLTGLTTVMCVEINNFSSNFQKCMDSKAEKCSEGKSSTVTSLVTNLYVEAANSNKYIQDAFLMLVPILQNWILEHSE